MTTERLEEIRQQLIRFRTKGDFDMNQSFLSNFGWLQQICMVSVQRNKK